MPVFFFFFFFFFFFKIKEKKSYMKFLSKGIILYAIKAAKFERMFYKTAIYLKKNVHYVCHDWPVIVLFS